MSAAAPSTAGHSVVCVGLTTLDVVHRVERYPTVEEKVTALETVVAAGGPAANAAIAAAALGADTALITALGGGPLATSAAADLAARGVDVFDALPASGDDTPTRQFGVSSVLVVDTTGERTVVSRSGADLPVEVDSQLQARVSAVVEGAAVVLIDGHHPALAAAAVEAATGPVLLDAGSWRGTIEPLLPGVTCAVCSSVFRMPGTLTVDESAAALRRAGVQRVAVTAGPRPVRWWDATGSGVIDTPTVMVRDTLGAGDVFHGAVARALAVGAEFPAALAFASRVACIRVGHAGPRSWLGDPALGELARILPDASHRTASTR